MTFSLYFITDDSDNVEKVDRSEIDLKTIDAFWLQRQLATYYKDAHVSQKVCHGDDLKRDTY